jgi:hypothetical protein
MLFHAAIGFTYRYIFNLIVSGFVLFHLSKLWGTEGEMNWRYAAHFSHYHRPTFLFSGIRITLNLETMLSPCFSLAVLHICSRRRQVQ